VKYKNTGKSDKQYRIKRVGDNNLYTLSEVKEKIQAIQSKE